MTASENCCIDFFDISQDKFKREGYITHIEDPVQQIDWSTTSKYIRVRGIRVFIQDEIDDKKQI